MPETSATEEGTDITKKQDPRFTEDEKKKLYADVLKAFSDATERHEKCIERIKKCYGRADELVVAISYHRSFIGSIAENLRGLINAAHTSTASSKAEPEQDGTWPVAHFELYRLERETIRLLEMIREKCRLEDVLWRLKGRFDSTHEIMEYTKMMANKCREAVDQT